MISGLLNNPHKGISDNINYCHNDNTLAVIVKPIYMPRAALPATVIPVLWAIEM